jgi:hypothetical protein
LQDMAGGFGRRAGIEPDIDTCCLGSTWLTRSGDRRLPAGHAFG